MGKFLWIPLIAFAIGLSVGCESQQRRQTTGLDEPITLASLEDDIPTAEEKPEGPLDWLAFWNWGDEPEEIEDPITADDVLSDMTPELVTRGRTEGDVDIDIARTLDLNGLSAWDDILNIWLLDQPTRLSETPAR